MPIENTDQVVAAQKGKQRAILYFQRDHEQIAKELAGALRAGNKLANMVYANLFNGPEDCEKCEAVAIQADAPKVHLIAASYKKTFPETELHFFNSEGDFVAGPQIEDTGRFVMPSLKKKGSEPVEPVPPTAEEVAAAKAAIINGAEDDGLTEWEKSADAEAQASREENAKNTATAPTGDSDTSGETGTEAADSTEAEAADDAEFEAGDDSGGTKG